MEELICFLNKIAEKFKRLIQKDINKNMVHDTIYYLKNCSRLYTLLQNSPFFTKNELASMIFESIYNEYYKDDFLFEVQEKTGINEQMLDDVSCVFVKSMDINFIIPFMDLYDIKDPLQDIENYTKEIHKRITPFLMKKAIASSHKNIEEIWANLLDNPCMHRPFARLVSMCPEDMQMNLFGKLTYDDHIQTFIQNYMSVSIIERAYKSYKMRVLLPVVANKARMMDMITYRPGTGVEYFKAKDFFENKKWMDE
jgi:hypothetical protein